MDDPSAPFRTAPHSNVAVRKGLHPHPSAPHDALPLPHRGRGAHGAEGVGETKGRRRGNKNKGLPHPQGLDLPDEGFWPAVPIAEVAPLWTVLRCASQVTLELAEELRDDHDILAWSPVIRVQRRLPRRRKTELVTKSLLPSFVFVSSPHVDEALDLAQRGRVHQCKWFLVNNGSVEVPGHQLSPLYQAQVRGTIRKRPLVTGDRVEILATVLYLAKAQVLRGPMRDDSYEVQVEGQRLRLIFPGFLLRKLLI